MLVVKVRSTNANTTLADVVASVADGEGLGSGDASERLAALWVAEDNDCDVLINESWVGDFSKSTYRQRPSRH